MLCLYIDLCSVILSGGQSCSTDKGDNTHADPGDKITVWQQIQSAAEFKMNVLKWSIPSHNISITNTNGEDSSDVSRNNFVSTVSIMMMSLTLQMHR